MSHHQQPVPGNETVTVGNVQEFPMTHIGHDELQTLTHNFRLYNILRVPDLASNLLFVHKLCLQNNSFYYFDAHKFSIQDLPPGRILYERLSKDGVYPIHTSSSTVMPSYSNAFAHLLLSNHNNFCFGIIGLDIQVLNSCILLLRVFWIPFLCLKLMRFIHHVNFV